MPLALADGQLAASSATVLGAGSAERNVMVTLHNTSAVTQTVVLSVSRNGGSSRTIFRGKLEQYETTYIDGISLNPADVLSGYATGASAVDYDVTTSKGSFGVFARDAEGAAKQGASLEVTLPDESGYSAAEVKIIGLLEDIRAIGLKIQ